MIKKIYNIFINIINSMKLKYKLLLSYFILILIPLCLFTILSYSNISGFAEKQSKYSASQALEQARSYLDNKISNILYVSDQITFDNNLGEILKRDENLPIEPASYKDYIDASSIVSRMFRKNDMNKITLYISDTIFYSQSDNDGSSNYTFSGLNSIKQETWYKKLKSFGGKLLWVPTFNNNQTSATQIKAISALRFMKYSTSANSTDFENIGVIKIDLLESDLNNILKKANTFKNSVSFIENSEGIFISTPNQTLTDKYKTSTETLAKLADNNNNWTTTKINNEKVMLGAQHINGTDWVIASIIPYKEILSSSNQTKNEMIFLMIIIAMLAYILAYFISNSITKRIRSLIKRMKKVQNGDLSAIMAVNGKDEMSELVENYNYMIDKMTGFIKLQYQAGQEVKSAELKALQAQINPHFLYNTLELIHWSAMRKNAPEISNIVQALAKFYKLSLSKGKDIISIRDELAHIETYVQLQNYRFKNKIHLMIDADEEIYQYSILKLLLQPVVENSIVHGILQNKGKVGVVKITAKLEKRIILFAIEDDGIGMAEEQTETILLDTETKSYNGYGVKNVNDRIKLYYGIQYGLTYRSALGQGTTVEIRIPAVKPD